MEKKAILLLRLLSQIFSLLTSYKKKAGFSLTLKKSIITHLNEFLISHKRFSKKPMCWSQLIFYVKVALARAACSNNAPGLHEYKYNS